MQYFCASRRCRDVAPAGESLSLTPRIAGRMKVTKARRPCCLRPCASLRATCGARAWAAPRNLLRAARSVRTDAVSQFTRQLHSSMQLLSPRPVLLGACKRGGRQEYRIPDSFLVGWALCTLAALLLLYSLSRMRERAGVRGIPGVLASMILIAANALWVRASNQNP